MGPAKEAYVAVGDKSAGRCHRRVSSSVTSREFVRYRTRQPRSQRRLQIHWNTTHITYTACADRGRPTVHLTLRRIGETPESVVSQTLTTFNREASAALGNPATRRPIPRARPKHTVRVVLPRIRHAQRGPQRIVRVIRAIPARANNLERQQLSRATRAP